MASDIVGKKVDLGFDRFSKAQSIFIPLDPTVSATDKFRSRFLG